MKLDSVQAIVRVLDEAGVRFLVAGGLAVNAHGYLRFTKDLDLVVELDAQSVRGLFDALATMGYRPSVPITADQFADPELRETLYQEKEMRVLQFWSDEHPETPVDVFVREPFTFEEEYGRADLRELAGVGSVRVVSLDTLIRMEDGSGPARRPRGRPASPDATGGRTVKMPRTRIAFPRAIPLRQ